MMTKAAITVSYGAAVRVGAVVSLVGSGYGKNEKITAAADACGQWLIDAIGQGIVVRCNSNGLSGGAFRDAEGRSFKTIYGLNVRFDPTEDSRLIHAAFFAFASSDRAGVAARVPHHDISEFRNAVYSPHLPSLEEAGRWLVDYGGQFCEEIKQALRGREAQSG